MKTVIEMAREAGIEVDWSFDFQMRLERLVELARADERERIEHAAIGSVKAAILYEREACAKVCESLPTVGNLRQLERATMKDCAIAIRNRSNT